jgi:hypothetical protein
VNGLGGLTSYMAREGIKNPLDGIRQFWIRAQEYHDQSGEGFRAYVDKKVASKQRHFNTRKNTDPHHED